MTAMNSLSSLPSQVSQVQKLCWTPSVAVIRRPCQHRDFVVILSPFVTWMWRRAHLVVRFVESNSSEWLQRYLIATIAVWKNDRGQKAVAITVCFVIERIVYGVKAWWEEFRRLSWPEPGSCPPGWEVTHPGSCVLEFPLGIWICRTACNVIRGIKLAANMTEAREVEWAMHYIDWPSKMQVWSLRVQSNSKSVNTEVIEIHLNNLNMSGKLTFTVDCSTDSLIAHRD